VFLISLPVILFMRFVVFIPLGMYAGVWRYASARDAVRAFTAVVVSEIGAVGFIVITQGQLGDFSRSVFVIDAMICSAAVATSRFAERMIVRGVEIGRPETRQVLIVGAGRTGRSLLRELRETPGERVIGFVDDDPALLGRRLNGVRILGQTHGIEEILRRTRPDSVLVTIPNASRERLDEVVRACAQLDVTCRFVRRDIDLDPAEFLGVETT